MTDTKRDERRSPMAEEPEASSEQDAQGGSPVPNPVRRGVWIALLAVCVASLLGHLALLPRMPEQVPIHWDAMGNVDGWSSRDANLFMNALPLFVLAVLYLSPRIDPRGRNYERFGSLYSWFVVALTLFVTAVTWTTEATVFGIMPENGSPLGSFISIGLGILFIGMGNYIPRVKQNYTFGIKTPWALHDERNWRLTHRFGGVAFIVMGVALIVVGALTTLKDPAIGQASILALIAIILMGTLAVFVYSYLVFRHGNRPLRS